MRQPIVTLTTDFGWGSPYVAAMKGVMLAINPRIQPVDLTHNIPHQDIRQAAIALAEVCDLFPPDTIHVAVVDPGVGTQRGLIYLRAGTQQFLAPDNGLLGRLALGASEPTIISLTKPEFWRHSVSATFHGRDILAPVAARLSLGLSPEQLGTPQRELVSLIWPEVRVSAGKIEGRIESIDSFGNLISDIAADKLEGVPRGEEQVSIECDEHETRGIFRTYADQPEMTLIALVGSTGRLELAIVGESAAAMLGVKPGTPISVKWNA